jgi:hypothetical protein
MECSGNEIDRSKGKRESEYSYRAHVFQEIK